jgi:hypothetical protein
MSKGVVVQVLLVGDERDPVCELARESLARVDQPWRHVPSLADVRLSIRLGEPVHGQQEPSLRVRFDDGLSLSGDDVCGVLLRTASGMQPAGWHPDDFAYASAEARSALIAWAWSMPCPVVNRPRPELWHREQGGALAWQRELRRSGLAIMPHRVRCGAGADVRRGLPERALLATGTSGSVFDVGDADAWERVASLAAIVPVTLTPRHGDAAIACIVDGVAVWAGDPAPLFRACAPGLARLADVTGLQLLEVVLVECDGRACVDSIDPWGCLGAFDEAARRDIGARLAAALTRPAARTLPAYEHARPACEPTRSTRERSLDARERTLPGHEEVRP